MKIKSIKQCKNLKNKTVLVRCDFDVPLNRGKTRIATRKNAEIVDDSRLKALAPTIKFLLKNKVKQIILIGHLGRPQGKVVKELSLLPVKNCLEKILKIQIYFIDCGIPSFLKDQKVTRDDSKIILLENLRFYPEEEKNDKKFAKKLVNLADIYINECFATSHRAHASINSIQNYLPSFAGLNLEKEIKNLSQVLNSPRKALQRGKPKNPLILIIGGSKIETKLPVINNFINKADYILIGGAVANNFLKAQGFEVGKSLIDKKYLSEAKKILKKSNNKLLLPLDIVTKNNSVKLLNEIKPTDRILDIGPKTILLFNDIINSAKTIVWNGPMGFFENKKFANGTNAVTKNIFKNKKAKIIIGGGETISVISNQQLIIKNKNIFISTGGGAMLEFLANKKLPGLKKLIEK